MQISNYSVTYLDNKSFVLYNMKVAFYHFCKLIKVKSMCTASSKLLQNLQKSSRFVG